MKLASDDLTGRPLRGPERLTRLVLILPVYVYIVTGWFIRPLSVDNIALAYAVPLSFVTGFLLFNVPKREALAMLERVWVELTLALLIAMLSILSVINSNDPIRVFRVLFPAVLPILLFVQLTALRSVSPRDVNRLPRIFLATGFAFACLPLFVSFFYGTLHDYTFAGGYRFMGFFDHESQLSVMVAVMVPLVIGEIAIAEKPAVRWLWITMLLVVFYTLVRVGSKTALLIVLAYACLFYIIAHARLQSKLRNLLLLVAVVGVMAVLGVHGIAIATAIDPIVGQKISAIFEGGIENYRTIQSRGELWREAWDEGRRHWLIGTGAGEEILGLQHAHNLILDYFRGIGVFGAVAVGLLCIRIAWRTVAKMFDVLVTSTISPTDIRVLACFSSATVYVVCNQLSNSFGPATISALWLIYLPAVLSEPVRRKSTIPRAAPHRTAHVA